MSNVLNSEESFDKYYFMNISSKNQDDYIINNDEISEFPNNDYQMSLFGQIIKSVNKEEPIPFSFDHYNGEDLVPDDHQIFNNNFFNIDDSSSYIKINTTNSPKDKYQKSLDNSEEKSNDIKEQDGEKPINDSKQIKEEGKVNITNNIDNIFQKNVKSIFLINEGKKKFLVYNIFNPKGNSEELKDIRRIIKEVILEKIKKESKMKIFNVSKKDKEKIIKVKRKRKHKPDDIRKKIKARFLKALRYRMNEELKYANSEKYFDFLPQCFICEITKKKNKSVLNMTLKEIMSTDFFEKYKKLNDGDNTLNNSMLNKKRECPDKVKYENNKEVMKYLKNNEEIKKSFNFDIIGDMTFSELFYEYLESKEFEKDILALKIEEGKENFEYIKEYIIKAYDFIKDFSN